MTVTTYYTGAMNTSEASSFRCETLGIEFVVGAPEGVAYASTVIELLGAHDKFTVNVYDADTDKMVAFVDVTK